MRSPASLFAELPREEQERRLAAMGEEVVGNLRRQWRWWARPEQLAPPGGWRWWGFVGGRGTGKTRSLTEFVCDRSEAFALANHTHRVGLVNRTFDDVRVVDIDGPGGLREVAQRRGHHLHHTMTGLQARLTIQAPHGLHTSHIELHTADRPDRIRGRNLHTLGYDEPAIYRLIVDEAGGTIFTNGDLALRAECPRGMVPQGILATTPKPIKLIKDLLAHQLGPTVISRGTLMDNLDHLAPAFVRAVLRRYAGTRLEAQEILGHLVEAVEGALWTAEVIELGRRMQAPDLERIVVAIDPSGSSTGNECGIVVAGVESDAVDYERRHVYVIDDLSKAAPPEEWAQIAVDAYHKYRANVIVAETNYGGEMVRAMISVTDPNVPYEPVTATRGKAVRAEPVSALYAQRRGGHVDGRVHHVGYFGELESELTTWVPTDPWSPNRLDALVWAVTALIPELAQAPAQIYTMSDMRL